MDIPAFREFCMSAYFHELKRRQSFYTDYRPPLLILALMFSANAFLVKEAFNAVPIFDFSPIPISLLILGVLSLLMFLYLLYYASMTLIGGTYREIQLRDFADGEDLTRQLAECAEHNSIINQRRVGYSYRCLYVLPLYALILSLMYVLLPG